MTVLIPFPGPWNFYKNFLGAILELTKDIGYIDKGKIVINLGQFSQFINPVWGEEMGKSDWMGAGIVILARSEFHFIGELENLV